MQERLNLPQGEQAAGSGGAKQAVHMHNVLAKTRAADPIATDPVLLVSVMVCLSVHLPTFGVCWLRYIFRR